MRERTSTPARTLQGMANPLVTCPGCGTKNRLPVVAQGHPRCPKCKTDLPWLIDAGDGDIDGAIDTSVLVVLDLWAPWCGPCRMIAPVLETLSREFAGSIKVVKVNVDQAPRTAARYQAQSIPLVLLLDRGAIQDSILGAVPAPQLRSRIEAALAAQASG